MNRLLVFLLLFFLSCSPSNKEVKSIEIMSYRYGSIIDGAELQIKPLLYAVVDESGNVNMAKTNRDELTYYNFDIEKKYLNIVEKETRDTSAKTYLRNPDSVKVCVCDYPVIRVKINYENSSSLSFNFDENDPSEKFKSAKYIFNELLRKSKGNDHITKGLDDLNKKRKAFVDYTIKKDMLELPLPPMPRKMDQIKFIKP